MIDKIIADNPVTISRLIGIGQVEVIMRKLESVLSLPGDVVELGCNIGTNALYVRRVLDAYKSVKEFHVYDSFEGLPAPLEVDGDKCGKGHMKQDPERLLKAFSDAGLKIPVIHKGWFAEIPNNEYPEKICFAFFDGDFYTSIMDSFEKVYRKMVPGGIIVVHDYTGEQLPGVAVACADFLEDKSEKISDVIKGMAVVVKL